MRRAWVVIAMLAVSVTACGKRRNEPNEQPAQADTASGETGATGSPPGSASSGSDSAAVFVPQDSLPHTRKSAGSQDSLLHGTKADTAHPGSTAPSGAPSPSGKHH